MPRFVFDPAALVPAASRIADEQGVDAITMRGLAAEVGVQAMTLYDVDSRTTARTP